MRTLSSTKTLTSVGDLPDMHRRILAMMVDAARQAITDEPIDEAFVYGEAVPFLRDLGLRIPRDPQGMRDWVSRTRRDHRRRHQGRTPAARDVAA